MVKILTMPFGYFEACCYLIQMPTATCLIDPAVRPDLLPPVMPPIRWLLATHGHFDHISQADALRQATGASLWIHEADSLCLTRAVRNMSMALQRPAVLQPAEKYLEDGQILILADGYSLEIIHTPGHTAGGVCLLLLESGQPLAIFTGDTLFAGSIGRLDLGGDPAGMQNSLIRLRELSQRFAGCKIPIYPGHGPSSELISEIENNPYFR